MADNVAYKSDAATTIATFAADDIGGGVLVSRGKVGWGADGSYSDVDTASGKALPVQPRDPSGNSIWATNTTAIASGTASNTVVKGLAGRLVRVLITAANTAAVAIYDNATTTSGTIIGVIPANTPAGSLINFDMPAANGITVGGASGNPGMTIAYS